MRRSTIFLAVALTLAQAQALTPMQKEKVKEECAQNHVTGPGCDYLKNRRMKDRISEEDSPTVPAK
jgi:hypothetical protein